MKWYIWEMPQNNPRGGRGVDKIGHEFIIVKAEWWELLYYCIILTAYFYIFEFSIKKGF